MQRTARAHTVGALLLGIFLIAVGLSDVRPEARRLHVSTAAPPAAVLTGEWATDAQLAEQTAVWERDEAERIAAEAEAARVEGERLEAERIAAEAARARPAPVPAMPTQFASPVASSGDCGSVNWMAAFIYQAESGCRPDAVNGSGCRGIGQACPGSKLPCGADFVCQHAWFEAYAFGRYGSWEGAYTFWIAHRWW